MQGTETDVRQIQFSSSSSLLELSAFTMSDSKIQSDLCWSQMQMQMQMQMREHGAAVGCVRASVPGHVSQMQSAAGRQSEDERQCWTESRKG